MRHDSASAAVVVMLRLKMYGMAQAVDRLRYGRADPVPSAQGRTCRARGQVHRLSPGVRSKRQSTIAEGVFYQCDYAGQSSTYNTYSIEDFFGNPEFELFNGYCDEIELSSTKVFVHRITCAGNGDSVSRKVLSPFTKRLKSAWYMYEGGVFSVVFALDA
jgi:hypothetical protein